MPGTPEPLTLEEVAPEPLPLEEEVAAEPALPATPEPLALEPAGNDLSALDSATPSPLPEPSVPAEPVLSALPSEETAGTPEPLVETPPPAPAAEEMILPALPSAPVEASADPAPAPLPEATEEPTTLAEERDSSLPDHIQREVDRIARRQEEELRRSPPPSVGLSSITGGSAGELDVTADQLELPRAPSPTEARPIRAIPIPEEFVPILPRRWAPQRKVWAAAATGHGPLYFQDAVLERYGQGVEQSLGPVGRFFSYPLDDPTQSKQRNQILQPFYSIGLFASQIALLPYNLVVDPPWEGEWDLGYYRPGDRIPPDTYYLPLHGVGPPLRGRRY